MSKWKVRRENTMFFHPDEDDVCYGPRWCITSPTGVSWGNKATFAEALAYADKRARTREYVLPRDINRPSKHLKIDSWITGATAVTTVDDGMPLLLTREELRPLALALLAHAERMKV